MLGQMEGDSPLPRTNSKLSGSTTRVPWRGGGTRADGSTCIEVSAGVPKEKGQLQHAPRPAGGDKAAWPEALALPTGSWQGQGHRSRTSNIALHSAQPRSHWPSPVTGAQSPAVGSGQRDAAWHVQPTDPRPPSSRRANKHQGDRWLPLENTNHRAVAQLARQGAHQSQQLPSITAGFNSTGLRDCY